MASNDGLMRLGWVNRSYVMNGKQLLAITKVSLSVDRSEYVVIMGPMGRPGRVYHA